MTWGESNRPGLLLPLAEVHQLLGSKGKEGGKWKEGRWLVDEGERDR